jgi:hypothetical protein
MDASQQEVRVALGMLIERARTVGVEAWCIVTIDDESGKIANVEGAFDDEVSAIAEAQRQKNELEKFLGPDEKGWTHLVVPYVARSAA